MSTSILFKGRCSSLGTLIQITSLTDKQLEKIAEYSIRERIEGKGGLTDNMKKELAELKGKQENPELMDGAKTLLRDWYAYQKGLDKGRTFIKDVQKGLIMEDATIELVDDVIFGSQGLVKNTNQLDNEFIQGTPDVIGDDFVLDVKSPWDSKTFLNKATDTIDKDYIWQLKGYCLLAKKEKAILAYGLVNTPTHACLMASFQGRTFDQMEYESTYSHIVESERVLAYEIPIEASDEVKIKQGISMCRDYLSWYDGLLKAKLGSVSKV